MTDRPTIEPLPAIDDPAVPFAQFVREAATRRLLRAGWVHDPGAALPTAGLANDAPPLTFTRRIGPQMSERFVLAAATDVAAVARAIGEAR